MDFYQGEAPPRLPAAVEQCANDPYAPQQTGGACLRWLEWLADGEPVSSRWVRLAAAALLPLTLLLGFVLGFASAPRAPVKPPATAAAPPPLASAQPAATSEETTLAEIEAIYQRPDVQDCLRARRAGAPHFIDWQAATWRVQKIFRRDRAFDEFLYEQIRPAPPGGGRLMRFLGGANLKGLPTCSLAEGWTEAGEFVASGIEETWEGDRHELTEYRNGRRHGRKVTWVRGQLAAYAEYQHGRQSGRQVTFWEDGSVQNREVTGREAAREGAARGQLFDPDLVADWPEPEMPAAIKTWLAGGKDGP